MILLDTNVVSALMQQRREALVDDWLDSQPVNSVWTTAITVFELQFGINSLPEGKKRTVLQGAFRLSLTETLGNRIAVFDEPAACQAGEIMASCKRAGRSAEIRDTMIAGITMALRATLATRNEKLFGGLGLKLVNPWLA